MKKLKRMFSLCMALVMVFSCLSISASAVGTDEDTALYNSLAEYADSYIEIKFVTTESTQVEYRNLQQFYAVARNSIFDLNDEDLAGFTMLYTGLGSLNDFPESMITEVLQSDSIISAAEYVAYGADGNAYTIPNAIALANDPVVFPTEDGYMELKTFAMDRGINANGYRFYYVWGMANWLKMPLMRMKDTLAITYSGGLDANLGVYGYRQQDGECSYCKKSLLFNKHDEYKDGNLVHNDVGVELDFSQANAVGVKVDLVNNDCLHTFTGDTISNFGVETEIRSFISGYIVVDSLTEIRTAYAHKTVGLSDITIGATVSDHAVTPTFSAGFATVSTNYPAAPLLLYP